MVLEKLNNFTNISIYIGEVHLCCYKLMGDNTGEIEIGSERGLYKSSTLIIKQGQQKQVVLELYYSTDVQYI